MGYRPCACISANQSDFLFHVVRLLENYEPALASEIFVHRPDFPSENAVYGHSKSGCLPVHRSTTADHKVGMPYEIQAVDNMLRNLNLAGCKQSWPHLADFMPLLLVAGQ